MPNKLTDNLANNSPISSNSLSDTEIKKALECISGSAKDWDCDKCPFDSAICTSFVAENALDLINRLQAEKTDLLGKIVAKNIVIDTQKAEVENLKDIFYDAEGVNLVNYWHQQCEIAENGNRKFDEENKSLKEDNETLKSCIAKSFVVKAEGENPLSYLKAEAYKEFATKATDKVEKVKQKYERLCKEQGEKMEEHMHIHFNGIIKIVKDLLNELVGDGDGK